MTFYKTQIIIDKTRAFIRCLLTDMNNLYDYESQTIDESVLRERIANYDAVKDLNESINIFCSTRSFTFTTSDDFKDSFSENGSVLFDELLLSESELDVLSVREKSKLLSTAESVLLCMYCDITLAVVDEFLLLSPSVNTKADIKCEIASSLASSSIAYVAGALVPAYGVLVGAMVGVAYTIASHYRC